jgi:hypothetical protein
MCEICDGASYEDVLSNIQDRVLRHGWSTTGVTASPDNPSWSYTIGLAANFDHPELVVVGVDVNEAAFGLSQLGTRIAAGERFDLWSVVDVAGVSVRFGGVHPAHFEQGTFAMWFAHHTTTGRVPPARALQLVLPDELRCPDCLELNRCLNDPTPIGPHLVPACASPAARPNRAARPRAERSSGRGRPTRRRAG